MRDIATNLGAAVSVAGVCPQEQPMTSAESGDGRALSTVGNTVGGGSGSAPTPLAPSTSASRTAGVGGPSRPLPLSALVNEAERLLRRGDTSSVTRALMALSDLWGETIEREGYVRVALRFIDEDEPRLARDFLLAVLGERTEFFNRCFPEGK